MNNSQFLEIDGARSLADLADAALIALCVQQLPTNDSAFAELAARVQSRIYHQALRYLRDPDDAWEVTQEVLISLFRNLHRFQGRSAFSTWLYRIVENQCHTFVDSRSRKTMTEHLGTLIRIHQEALTPLVTDCGLEQEAESERVAAALAALPARAREVLDLRFVRDLSLEEIAAALDIGLSATKMRLYRAMEAFREQYLLIAA